MPYKNLNIKLQDCGRNVNFLSKSFQKVMWYWYIVKFNLLFSFIWTKETKSWFLFMIDWKSLNLDFDFPPNYILNLPSGLCEITIYFILLFILSSLPRSKPIKVILFFILSRPYTKFRNLTFICSFQLA